METDLILQQAIEMVLFETAETARVSLRAGATALEVVETAMIALENCPIFNAGKGAALTEDATHEVRL
jgi:beta-aspartyl-peptidase (threonine type)